MTFSHIDNAMTQAISTESADLSSLWLNLRQGMASQIPLTDLAQARQSARHGSLGECLRLCNGEQGLLSEALDIAFSVGRGLLAAKLIEQGAWLKGPSGPSGQAPLEAALDRLWLAIARRIPDAPTIGIAMDALEASGRPAPNWTFVVLAKVKANRYGEALDICDHLEIPPPREACHAAIAQGACTFGGVSTRMGERVAHYIPPAESENFWAKASSSTSDRSTPAFAQEHQALWRFLTALQTPLPQSLRQQLWHQSIVHGAIDNLDALAASGNFPSDWSCSNPEAFVQTDGPEHCGSLLAQSVGKPAIFAALSKIPMAVQAAQAHPPSAAFVANLSSNHICALAKAGVDVAASNHRGENFLHLWARQPLGGTGWASVLRLAPGAHEARESFGMTPVEIHRETIRAYPVRVAQFNQMIAGIDQSELARSTPVAKPTVAKPRL